MKAFHVWKAFMLKGLSYSTSIIRYFFVVVTVAHQSVDFFFDFVKPTGSRSIDYGAV